MTEQQINGLILILMGLYSVIRFKYNAKTTLKSRKKLARILSFGKLKEESSKSELIYAQLGYVIGGILFIIIGLTKLLG